MRGSGGGERTRQGWRGSDSGVILRGLERRGELHSLWVIVVEGLIVFVHADVGEDARVVGLESEERAGGDLQVGRCGGRGGAVRDAEQGVGARGDLVV